MFTPTTPPYKVIIGDNGQVIIDLASSEVPSESSAPSGLSGDSGIGFMQDSLDEAMSIRFGFVIERSRIPKDRLNGVFDILSDPTDGEVILFEHARAVDILQGALDGDSGVALGELALLRGLDELITGITRESSAQKKHTDEENIDWQSFNPDTCDLGRLLRLVVRFMDEGKTGLALDAFFGRRRNLPAPEFPGQSVKAVFTLLPPMLRSKLLAAMTREELAGFTRAFLDAYPDQSKSRMEYRRLIHALAAAGLSVLQCTKQQQQVTEVLSALLRNEKYQKRGFDLLDNAIVFGDWHASRFFAEAYLAIKDKDAHWPQNAESFFAGEGADGGANEAGMYAMALSATDSKCSKPAAAMIRTVLEKIRHRPEKMSFDEWCKKVALACELMPSLTHGQRAQVLKALREVPQLAKRPLPPEIAELIADAEVRYSGSGIWERMANGLRSVLESSSQGVLITRLKDPASRQRAFEKLSRQRHLGDLSVHSDFERVDFTVLKVPVIWNLCNSSVRRIRISPDAREIAGSIIGPSQFRQLRDAGVADFSKLNIDVPSVGSPHIRSYLSSNLRQWLAVIAEGGARIPVYWIKILGEYIEWRNNYNPDLSPFYNPPVKKITGDPLDLSAVTIAGETSEIISVLEGFFRSPHQVLNEVKLSPDQKELLARNKESKKEGIMPVVTSDWIFAQIKCGVYDFSQYRIEKGTYDFKDTVIPDAVILPLEPENRVGLAGASIGVRIAHNLRERGCLDISDFGLHEPDKWLSMLNWGFIFSTKAFNQLYYYGIRNLLKSKIGRRYPFGSIEVLPADSVFTKDTFLPGVLDGARVGGINAIKFIKFGDRDLSRYVLEFESLEIMRECFSHRPKCSAALLSVINRFSYDYNTPFFGIGLSRVYFASGKITVDDIIHFRLRQEQIAPECIKGMVVTLADIDVLVNKLGWKDLSALSLVTNVRYSPFVYKRQFAGVKMPMGTFPLLLKSGITTYRYIQFIDSFSGYNLTGLDFGKVHDPGHARFMSRGQFDGAVIDEKLEALLRWQFGNTKE